MTAQFPKGDLTSTLNFYDQYAIKIGNSWTFPKEFQQTQLTTIQMPWATVCPVDSGLVVVKNWRVHKKCAESLKAILDEIWVYCKKDQKIIEKYKLHIVGGTFVPRTIRGISSSPSTHAGGFAIDFNPAENGLGDETPQMPKFVVAIFNKHGWTWGGTFTRCDGMHFQATSTKA